MTEQKIYNGLIIICTVLCTSFVFHSDNTKNEIVDIDVYVQGVKNKFQKYNNDFFLARLDKINSDYANKLINATDTNFIKLKLIDRDQQIENAKQMLFLYSPALMLHYGTSQRSKDSLVHIITGQWTDCSETYYYFYNKELVLTESIKCETIRVYYFNSGMLVYYEDNEVDSKAIWINKGSYKAKFYFKDGQVIDSLISGNPNKKRSKFEMPTIGKEIILNANNIYKNHNQDWLNYR